MNYKNLGVFSVIVMFFLAACSASTPVIPINTLPSSVISVKNENFSVDFEKCESELTLSSNVKCSFLVTNLKNIAQDVTADRSTVIILNSDNTTYSVDNLAFSGGVLDVSSKAAFPPLGRLKLEMRLTLPKGVTTIIQLSVSLGKYGPLIGKMANLNVDGSPQDMNPSSALPGERILLTARMKR